MRLILIASFLLSLSALAMDGGAPGRIFNVQLGAYENDNLPHLAAHGDVDDVPEADLAGDDSETSRYQALAPTAEESSEEEQNDPDDQQLHELFFGARI